MRLCARFLQCMPSMSELATHGNFMRMEGILLTSKLLATTLSGHYSQSLEFGESCEAGVAVDGADEVAAEVEGLEGGAERGHRLVGHLGELVVPHAPEGI